MKVRTLSVTFLFIHEYDEGGSVKLGFVPEFKYFKNCILNT